MFPHKIDLAPQRDSSNRFLPWIIALMVYLAGLSLSVGILIDQLAKRWSENLKDSLTVVVEPVLGASKDEIDSGVEEILNVILVTPGIISATPLARSDVAEFIKPWLGEEILDLGLPIPTLIDIKLEPKSQLDIDLLRQRVETVVPGTQIDDHNLWLHKVLTLANATELIAGFIIFLIALAAGTTVIFATRTGLAVQLDVIEVLHLIGARDDYIAKQFQQRAVPLALLGGMIGLIMTAATIAIIWLFAHELEGNFFPSVRLNWYFFIPLALLPLGAALIAALTVRVTVMRFLAQIL